MINTKPPKKDVKPKVLKVKPITLVQIHKEQEKSITIDDEAVTFINTFLLTKYKYNTPVDMVIDASCAAPPKFILSVLEHPKLVVQKLNDLYNDFDINIEGEDEITAEKTVTLNFCPMD